MVYFTLQFVTGCIDEQKQHPDFLGSAVIESGTRLVSAVAQGPLVAVYVVEGQHVHANDKIAIIDTIPYHLSREEIKSGISELNATIAAKKAQIEAIDIEMEGLQREFTRISGLAAKGAATAQQRDNLATKLETAKARLAAARTALRPLGEKEKTLKIRKEKVDDQIRRCYLKTSTNGIVLTLFRNTGEVAGPGSPIVEIGQYDTMHADFFVPQPTLSTLKYGKQVRIRIDMDSAGTHTDCFVPAVISWIGEEAEFTPKNIQTRQSRNELVFRIRCTVANPDGILKRGLPVEVWR